MKRIIAALLAASPFAPLSAAAETTAPAAAEIAWTPPGAKPCTDLPKGALSDAELAALIPDGSPGKVRVRWTLESQEECYGFNIHRADGPDKPFRRINKTVIPGEGSTNIPKSYCYEDNSVERGKTYFYYIDEVSLQGVVTKLKETMGPDDKGTKVVVRTVPDDRAWLRRKALGDDATTATATPRPTSAPPADTPAPIARPGGPLIMRRTPPPSPLD